MIKQLNQYYQSNQFSARKKEYQFNETTKQLTETIDRKTHRTKFRFQLGFHRHLETRTDNKNEKRRFRHSVKLNRIRTQSDLESANSKLKNEVEAKIGKKQMKVSGWAFDTNTSIQLRMYRAKPLIGETYAKLPISSQELLNIKNSDRFCPILTSLSSE